MEIRFADIFNIYRNDKSFLWSPLTLFKLQCWDLVFTWINQLSWFAVYDTFGEPFRKKKEFFSQSIR